VFLLGVYDVAIAHADHDGAPGPDAPRPIDEYVAREIDATAATATEEFDRFRFNHGLQAVRELVSLLRRYREHVPPRPETFGRGVETVAALLTPVAPHVTEEMWEVLGHDGLIAEADWPGSTPPADYGLERRLIEDTRADVRDIVDVAGIDDPETIRIGVAPEWKHEAHAAVRDSAADNVVGAVMGDERFRRRGEAAAAFVKELAAERQTLGETLSPERERTALERAAWLIEREFDAAVEVAVADGALADDARPGRPAIRID
jgi:leucyl-tRNA synthetase